MNNAHPTIKFTYKINEFKINFWTCNIFKGPTFLSTLKLDTETN